MPLDSALQTTYTLECMDGGDVVQVDVQIVSVETWDEMQRMCTHQHIQDGLTLRLVPPSRTDG